MQPLSLSPNYCLANVLPDRCSTRPAIPGVVSHESGDYRTTSLSSNRPVRSHRELPECRYCLDWLPPTPPESPNDFRPSPAGYSELLSLRIHSHSHIQNMSGLSPYCCYIIRAFTVLPPGPTPLICYILGLARYITTK